MKREAVSEKWKVHYDEYYAGTELTELTEWRRLGATDKVNNIVKACSTVPHGAILEIGCGEGSVLKRLADVHFGDRLYGLEIAQSAVEAAICKDIKSLVECKIFDGYTVPYDNNQFDLAVLTHVIEHLDYPRRLIYEAARVADYVFIEVPLEDNVRLTMNYTFTKVGHINFYSFKTIRRLVQTCDLDILSQTLTMPSINVYRYDNQRYGVLQYALLKSGLRIFPAAAATLFTYHCSILCKKRGTIH